MRKRQNRVVDDVLTNATLEELVELKNRLVRRQLEVIQEIRRRRNAAKGLRGLGRG